MCYPAYFRVAAIVVASRRRSSGLVWENIGGRGGGEKGDGGGRGEEKGDVGGQDLFKGSAFRPSLWSSSEVHRKPFVMPGEISIAVLSRGARGLAKPWVDGGGGRKGGLK